MNKKTLGIVGNGSLAKHLSHYCHLKGIPFISWSRSEDKLSPEEKLHKADTILLLISDDSINDFINRHPDLQKKQLIHCSGSLVTDLAMGYHPLMTFSHSLYGLEFYSTIPFVGEIGSPHLRELIPEWDNPYYAIPKEQRALYHALCVVGGNFTNIIWAKVFRDFKEQLKLPDEILHPYLEQTVKNIKTDPYNSLTGPIKRGDTLTMKRNRKALNNRIWNRIYKLFNRVYRGENS